DAVQADLVWDADRNFVLDAGAPAGDAVKVAVIDTGIDYTHPDLNVAGGVSFVDYTTDYMDDHSHGTHCAGTIAALDNEIGLIGVAPEAELYGVKVLNYDGFGRYSDIIAGVDWAVANGMDIVSMSLGGSYSLGLEQACNNAYAAGVTVVAAAGNSGNTDGTGDSVKYPARYDSVIAVAAMTSNYQRASFSSTGPAVEVMAPGVFIYSTIPGSTYSYKSGTSMACPHVAGVAALVKSANPSLSSTEIREILRTTTQDLGLPAEWQGAGLVRADNAVAAAGVPIKMPPVAGFTATPTSGTYPLTVAFTDQSTGDGITAWKWSFGDGATSSAQNPSHTYTAAGTYTVSLTVACADGTDTETKSGYITVRTPVPAAEFTAAPTTGTYPLTVAFTDQSNGDGITAWKWDFGDGTSSTAQNPSHTYSVAGTYTVSLTVTNAGGTDTESKPSYIAVKTPAPSADFAADRTAGTYPLAVTFTDQSTGDGITGWKWNFGDGATSTAQHPSHTYASTGTYTVSLTVTNAGGTDTESKSSYISVTAPAPSAAFAGIPTKGTYPLTVAFTDKSTGDGINAWNWNFGDGTSSTAQNPSHTYTTAGTYTVSLTITGAGGSDKETKSGYISVSTPAPSADFTADLTTGKVPLGVYFADRSAGDAITAWKWDFGDGTTSTAQNPSHTYNTAGTYTVSLTITNAGGTDTETKTGYITVKALNPPVADFTATPTKGKQDLKVQFTDTSANNPTAWKWDFGDGASSTLQHPAHTYTAAGTYTVSLTAANADGSDTVMKTGYITVTELIQPVAAFTADPVTGTAPLGVTFTDASTDASAWAWDFGDGAKSTAQNPAHTYTDAGTYTVSLTVTSTDMLTDTATATVTALAPVPPEAVFSPASSSGKAPYTVQFTDASTGAIAWSWDFGDGISSTEQDPSHTYQLPGTYTVTLTVTSAEGLSDTATGTVSIRAPLYPVALFSATPTEGKAPLDVTFTDTSLDATSWVWNFGDGTTSSTENPSHTYAEPGTYTVTLTARSVDGYTDTASAGITVLAPVEPDASFTATPTTGTAPLNVVFSDTSTNAVSRVWDFGDTGTSSTSTEVSPAHTYTIAGTYTATLTVTSADGLVDTFSQTITASAPATPPTADFSWSPNAPKVGQKVRFSDLSTDAEGKIVSWQWDFGDGSYSIEENPQHIFTDTKYYLVKLKVLDDQGEYSIKTAYIGTNDHDKGKADSSAKAYIKIS
ncbi:MAG: PKD domain-containing protein, partial [Methanomicrobiaceae archaeon]|nr:PKD domain-containing protein [Methanomicrobiaceae archaeon]